MIPCQRHLFDIPEDVPYLNCAYMSPLMKPALESGIAGLARKARPWQITPDQFFTGAEEFRRVAAQFLEPVDQQVDVLARARAVLVAGDLDGQPGVVAARLMAPALQEPLEPLHLLRQVHAGDS